MKNLVWLASYPRSGNTWFRVFLSSLLSGAHRGISLNNLELDLIANSRYMFDEMAGINSSDLTPDEINTLRPDVFRMLSRETDQHLYLKTHDQFLYADSGSAVFPEDCSFGCVYIIRNPLDVVVSNAFYFNKSFDKIIKEMGNPLYRMHPSSYKLFPVLEERSGTWSQHVMSWVNSGLNIHVMRYEDMLSDPFTTFSETLAFLNLSVPEDRVLKAIEETSFGNLKKKEEQSGFKEKIQSCNAFFRAGKAGAGENFLTETQIARVMADHRDVMDRYDYV